MLIVDKLAYQSRWIQVAPGWKGCGYLILLVLAFGLPWQGQLIQVLMVTGLTCWCVRLSIRRYLRWLGVPLVFLGLSLIGILFSWSALPQSLLWGISLGAGHGAIGIDSQSLSVALQTGCRSLAALTATFLFMLTTPFQQQLRLWQQLRLPVVLIEFMALTYRFIFLVFEEAQIIHQAQSLRFGYTSVRGSYHSLSMLVGLLLQRVLTRYRQMEIALDIKLFQGEFHL